MPLTFLHFWAFKLLQFSVKFQNFWRRQANSHSFSAGRRKASNTTDVPGEAENKAAFLDRTQRLGRKGRRFPRRRPIAVQCAARSQGLKDAAPTSHSDIEYTSSSEQSCSTVIYLGRSHPLRRQLETSRRMAINESLERFPPELADHQTKNMEEKSAVPIAGCHSQENIKARRHSADDGTDVAHEDAQPSGTLPPKATTRHREDYKQRQRLKQRQKHLLSSRSIELWVDGPKSQQAVGPSAWTRASRAVKYFQTTRPDTNLWHRTDWQAAETRGALSKGSSEEIKESENQVRCQLELDGQPGAFSLQQSTLKHLRKCKQGYFLAEPRTGRLVPPVVSSDLHQDECSQVNTNAQKNEDRVELPLTLGSPSLSRSQLQRKPEISRREVYQEQQSRVTPFVKEWIENQNNVFSSGPRESLLQPAQPTSDGDTWPQIHTILNPISCLEGQVETIIKSGPAVEVATPLTSIRSRFGRNAASKGARGRDSPMRIVFPINNKYPLTPSRSLPRTNNTEGWIQRSPFTDSSLSRVARWVESVSKETSSGSPGMPTAKSPKARHQPKHLPPSCGAPIGAPASAALPLNSDVKVPQTNAGSRIGSAPAVHSHHALHCLAHFKPVEDTIPVLQCLSGSGVAAGAAKYDLHKPGGASDPGFSQDLHLYSREKEPKQQQQQQPANNVGCPMELPKQKAVSKRQNRTHKRLQKFADFFVCSPHAPARQNTAMLTGPGTRPSTARVRKMCAPFFWPSRERERSDDVLSVDSVGMLFTTSVKRKDDRNLSCAPQPRTPHCEATIELVETPTKPVLKPKHRYKPGDLPLLKKSDDSDGHWLGFVPTSRFTDCAGQSSVWPTGLGLSTKLKNCVSLGHDMAPVGMRTTTTPGDPVPTKYNATAVHSAGEHFIVPTTNTNTVNANSPKIAPNPIRQWPIKVFSSTSAKCVSQSSSSGLGSEHSCADSAIRTDVVNEPAKASTDTSMPTVRCYCKQSTGRSPRCKACGHYSQIHRHIEVSDAYLELVKGTPQLGVSKTLPYLADASLPLNAGSTGPSPVIESREPSSYVGGGGHASSGYDSILRDSEVSSHSETTSESSVGHMRFAGEACQCGALMLSTLHQQLPLMGRNSKDDAACQTSPFPLENHVWDGKGTCEVKSMQPTLDGSLTLTESFSEATASVAMDSSTTSKNSNPRPLSPSTSKRSISVPGQSEHTSEDSTSSLPSVRRVSPILNRVQCSLESVRLSESQALQTFTTEASCITASEDDANEVRKRKIISLLSRQEALKAELTAAKSRLLADPGSWGFDLNVTQRMDLDDECFVEALENETELLQQRVNACNFHVKYVSYFQPPSLGSDP
uniref:Uncharacterized protein n=1 Tax=Schistocephalus solidus TaxID=70667 RepID=A0A0V0J1K0_SCHSO